MPSQHRTKLIGWHSADPTLKPWIAAQSARLGMSVREFLDGVLFDARAKYDPSFRDSRDQQTPREGQ